MDFDVSHEYNTFFSSKLNIVNLEPLNSSQALLPLSHWLTHGGGLEIIISINRLRLFFSLHPNA